MSALTVTWMPRPTDEQFSVAAPLLQRVIDEARTKADFTVEDLHRLARLGRVLIGLAFRDGQPVMVAAVELVHYPRASAVNVMALGGRGLREVADAFFGELKDFARSMGASRIEASGSPAMARLLRRFQFTLTNVKVECQL